MGRKRLPPASELYCIASRRRAGQSSGNSRHWVSLASTSSRNGVSKSFSDSAGQAFTFYKRWKRQSNYEVLMRSDCMESVRTRRATDANPIGGGTRADC